jgi:hypothetical protein
MNIPPGGEFVNKEKTEQGKTIVLPGQTPEGEYILSVLLKRSYHIVPNGRCVRADKDFKIVTGDMHYDGPMNSSVQFESDFVPFKLGTDVVLNANAYAPGGSEVHELIATVLVDSHRKDIAVIGDRVSKFRAEGDPMFTEPEPFTVMPLCYERAYGGVDIYTDTKMSCPYARNHLGRGFVIANSKKTVDNLSLPNIESVEDRLTPDRLCVGHFMHWERQPMPQGFGWYGKCWQPRALLAGVMPADKKLEAELRAAYTQLVPLEQRELYDQTRLPDMDFRFFNGASPGLALPFLSANETITTINLTPEGSLVFQLPGEAPRIGLDIGFGVQEPPVFLQTVMIRMEERLVDLVWRGAVSYPGPDWLPEMRKMEVSIA